MGNWIDVAKVSEFPPNTMREVNTEDHLIMVFNINGSFYAIQNLCTHDGGTLSDGEIEGEEIVCPRHGAHFCVCTGEATQPPAYDPVATFAVRVVDGIVQVCDELGSSSDQIT